MKRLFTLPIYFQLLLIGDLAIIYMVFISSIGVNPQNGNVNVQAIANTFMPEGWAFFTRNPREDILDVYKLGNTGEPQKFILPNGDYSFGASRKSRVLAYQLGILLASQLNAAAWKSGVGDFRDSLALSTQFIPVLKDIRASLFVPGKYVLVLTERLPWLWDIQPRNTKKRFKFISISIGDVYSNK